MTLGERFESVLAAARTGSEWAWSEIYSEFSPRVYGYLRAKAAAEADDVLGEVFLHLVRDIGRFSGDESNFQAWVFTIARNRLLDHERRRARRLWDAAPPERLEAGGEHGDVEQEALRSLGSKRVREVISKLSPDQQDVLLLRIVGGLTVDEIARTIGKRPGAVKALQRRGLAAIRREISKEGVTLWAIVTLT